MGQLIVDRLSAKALQKLGELAARQGRSKEELAGEILETALQPDAKARADVARRIRSMTPADVSQSDSVDLLRQIRRE